MNEHLDLAGAVFHPALNTAAVRHAIDKRAKSYALNATAQDQFARDARGHCVSLGAILSSIYVLQRIAEYGPFAEHTRRPHGLASRGVRTPLAHQIRQAPSSDTMHGPIGVRGVQARP